MKYNPKLAEIVNREVELEERAGAGKKGGEKAEPPKKVEIAQLGDFWRIDGVQYRNGIHTVDLAKTLLENGEARTQDDWAKHYESAIDGEGFYTPDYPLFYGLVKALHSVRDDTSKSSEVVSSHDFIRDNSRAKWMMTLTRVRYNPAGNDEVIHNYGTRNQYEEQVGFVGVDEWIKNTANPFVCQKLLNTTDGVAQINEVFKWLNGTDAYLWRVNKRPDKIDERVAWFNASSVRAGLDCGGDPPTADSPLGDGSAGAKKI